MSYEDNTQVVELIENSPKGILPLLAEECFFPNGSDATWLQKMKQVHAKNPVFSEDRMNRNAFTVHHYPGKVTYLDPFCIGVQFELVPSSGLFVGDVYEVCDKDDWEWT